MFRLDHKQRLHVGYYKLVKLDTYAKVHEVVVCAENDFRFSLYISLVHPQLLPISDLIPDHIDLIICYHQGYNMILAENYPLNTGTYVDFSLEGKV